jgi:hypothetical protein
MVAWFPEDGLAYALLAGPSPCVCVEAGALRELYHDQCRGMRPV